MLSYKTVRTVFRNGAAIFARPSFKVAFVGAPSVGKTTIFDLIPEHERVIKIPEVARRIYTEHPELKTHPIFQRILLLEQYMLESQAEKRSPSIIFTDRGYLDVLAYSRYFGYKVDDKLIGLFRPYDLICYVSPEGVNPSHDYKTPQGKVERLEVDRHVKDVISESKIPSVTLEGSPQDRVETLFGELHRRFSTISLEGVFLPRKERGSYAG